MRFPTLLLSLCIPLLLAACEPREPDVATATDVASQGRADANAPAATDAVVAGAPAGVQGDDTGTADAGSVQPAMVVHKSPTCGCCLAWADQMQAAGFDVELRDVDDVAPIKQALGVPASSASCHTAEVGGYFIEGHVPADDIRRLLEERPDARGLAVPGMPVGSPGMEVPSGARQPYEVLLVRDDGSTTVFARHGD